MTKQIFLFVVLFFGMALPFQAHEGLWLPFLVKDQQYDAMRESGLELSAEAIYSINQACLKDAVIGLMGEGSNYKSFGTASFVSAEGLIVTNFHCILGYLERISTEENDFLKYGYWAQNKAEETWCHNLMVKQLVKMEDVTSRILRDTDGLEGKALTDKINENGIAIAREMTKETDLEAHTQSLMAGNQYIMSFYKVFKDVRMVAAPPTAIGKFGGNADNWKWPRHTGDFAFLRVYADSTNRPAAHHRENCPYVPENYLKISAEGGAEGDFAMVLGYPGETYQYIPSFGLEKIMNNEHQTKIKFYRDKLRILEQAIEEAPSIRLRYYSRMSSVGNQYLRLLGELNGVQAMGLIEQKRAGESAFTAWVNSSTELTRKYGEALPRMDSIYRHLSLYNLANTCFQEVGIGGAEIVPFIGKFEKLVSILNRGKASQNTINKESERLLGLAGQFFRNWDYEVDRQLFRSSLFHYWNAMPAAFRSDETTAFLQTYDGDLEQLTSDLFAQSLFTYPQRLEDLLQTVTPEQLGTITNDPLYRIAISYYKINVEKIARQRGALQAALHPYYKLFQEGLAEYHTGKTLFPDGNSSLRYAYGKVGGAVPEDGLLYQPFTYFTGMYRKHLAHAEEEDYYFPQKLQALYAQQQNNGEADLPVCFLTDCHTSKGMSGSPVVNSKGELIGLNFDRIWQGVVSDYQYSPELSRNINVDIRFILFLLQAYSPNRYVLDELSVVDHKD